MSKNAAQLNLFGEPKDRSPDQLKKVKNSKPISGLQISTEDSTKENKLKKQVESRLKKIEKLKSLLEKDRNILNTIKQFYHSILSSYPNTHFQEVEYYIEALLKRYGQKSFAVWQRDTLAYLIDKNLDNLHLKGHSSETLDALISKYNAIKTNLYADDKEFDNEEFDEGFQDLDFEKKRD